MSVDRSQFLKFLTINIEKLYFSIKFFILNFLPFKSALKISNSSLSDPPALFVTQMESLDFQTSS